MISSPDNTAAAIRYFLRELGEAERDSLEERLFADSDLSELFDAVENDLVDEYLRGEMDPTTRTKFESGYLISERRRLKVSAARIFSERITEPTITLTAWESLTRVFRIPRLAWASGIASLIVLGFVAGWLLLRPNGPPQVVVRDENMNSETPVSVPDMEPAAGVGSDETETERAASGNINPSTARRPTNSGSETSMRRVVAFTLLPPVRSGERPVLTVTRPTQTVSLRIVHDNEKEFAKYQVDIFDQNGELIWGQEMPVNRKRLSLPINISVRGSTLKSGAYELKLSGITDDDQTEDLKFYNFAVRRQ